MNAALYSGKKLGRYIDRTTAETILGMENRDEGGILYSGLKNGANHAQGRLQGEVVSKGQQKERLDVEEIHSERPQCEPEE